MPNKGIIVDMPENIYVSYDKSRTVENEFHFTLYKELQTSSKAFSSGNGIILSPTVYIQGFEQLVQIKQDMPEQQKAQIIAAAEHFINSLVFGDMVDTKASDWNVRYLFDDETRCLSIVIMYISTALSQDFSIKFSANNFICNTVNTQNAVVLTVRTEGFDTLFGDLDAYDDYRTAINVQYAPCVTKFTAHYDGADFTESLYVNPVYNNKIGLRWEIAGNGKIEHTLKRGNVYIKEAPSTDAVEDKLTEPVWYTLEADNQKGFSDKAQIQVKVTKWRKMGAVSGLSNDAESFSKSNMRIFYYKNSYYCYHSNALYRSNDGCIWSEFSKNTALPADTSVEGLSYALHGDTFYIMTGTVSSRLKIMCYDFRDKQWQYSPAHQNCISSDGSLALSNNMHYYAQTVTYGMRVSGHSKDEDWAQWNKHAFAIGTEEDHKALCSSLCFWKDTFYAAILCDDGKLRYYKCREDVEEALFSVEMDKKESICLLPTTNKMMIAAQGFLFDVGSKTVVDDFLPPVEGFVWFGSNSGTVFGIFPDGNFWIYAV